MTDIEQLNLQRYVAELSLNGRYQWCIVEAIPRQEKIIEKFGCGPDAQKAAYDKLTATPSMAQSDARSSAVIEQPDAWRYKDFAQDRWQLSSDKPHDAWKFSEPLYVGVAQGSWQPIETAPKMKVILLFAVTDVDDDGRVRNWKMATGSWHTGWEGDETQTAWFWDGHQVPKYATKPTHWMPLPEAPSLPSTEGK